LVKKGSRLTKKKRGKKEELNGFRNRKEISTIFRGPIRPRVRHEREKQNKGRGGGKREEDPTKEKEGAWAKHQKEGGRRSELPLGAKKKNSRF